MLIQNDLMLHGDAHRFYDSTLANSRSALFLVQNGAVTQKDTLNDDEFEPYLSTQARQVRVFNQPTNVGLFFLLLNLGENNPVVRLISVRESRSLEKRGLS